MVYYFDPWKLKLSNIQKIEFVGLEKVNFKNLYRFVSHNIQRIFSKIELNSNQFDCDSKSIVVRDLEVPLHKKMDNTIEMYFVEEAKTRDLEWLVQVLKDTNMTFSEIGKYYDETFMDIFRKYIPNDRLNLLLKVEIFFKSIHNKFQQNDSTSSMSIAIGENTESNLIITYSNLNREMQEILQSSVANRNNSGGQIQPPNSSGVGGNPDEDDDEEDEEQWICPSNNLLESPGRGTCDNLADHDHCNQSEDSRDYFENAMKRYPPQSQVNLLPDHNRFGQIAQFNCALYTLPDLDQLAEEIKIANNAKKKNAIYQKVVDKIFRQMISEYFVYSMPEHVASFVCMLCCNHYPEFAINDDPRPERHLHEKLKNKFSNYRSSIGKKTSELKLHIDSTIKKRKPPITSIVNSKSKRNQLKHQTAGHLQAPSTNNNNNNNNINLNNLFQHELVDNNNRNNNNNSQIQLNHNSHNNSLDNILLKSP